MRKRYKIWLIVIIILIIFTILIGLSKLFVNKKEEPKPQNTTSIISNINDFGYSLDDRDTKYMKEEFKKLEEILKSKSIDYEKYAQSIATLFAIDFYTLNNKINKYDIGALEYIYKEKLDEFKNKAMDTIYGDIIDNTYKDRVQELPEISHVEIIKTAKTKITLNKEEVEAYEVTMKYTYKKDLGFDQEGSAYLVKNADKLEIALYNPTIKE